jgi:acetate kinase
MREILKAIDRGDQRALLARNKFIYDIKRYIGEYLVMLEGVDAISFTGGIGEHDAALRAEVLLSLRFLGVALDEERNAAHETVITRNDSPVRALVIQTNEEIVVARETVKVIGATAAGMSSPAVSTSPLRYR